MTKPTLETDRLILRPYGEGDTSLSLKMNMDPKVMRFISKEETEAEVLSKAKKWISYGTETFYLGIWVMVRKDTSMPIGCIALVEMPRSDPAIEPVEYTEFIEIGYRSIPEAWGFGFNTEAAACLRDFFFANSNKDVLVACTDPANSKSQNILHKIGLDNIGKQTCYGEELPFFKLTRKKWEENFQKNG